MLRKIFRAKLEKKFLPNCFSSLDYLPIRVWWDIHETANVGLLVKGKSKDILLSSNEINILNKKWSELVNDYIKRYGFSEKYQEIINRKKKLAGHLVNRIVKEDRTQTTFIRILENEIKELEDEISLSKTDNMQLKAYLDKEVGFRIDPGTCSVSEYMSYLKLLENKNAAVAA